MLRRALILCLLLLVPTLVQAQHIKAELVAEGPAPPGGEVELAISMRPEQGWHGYWQNPGDAGLPMDVQWTLPAGFTAGPLRYPVPTRLEIAGLMNYVFEKDYAVLVRLKVPPDARGTIPIRAEARWLACTDKICVPEQGQLALDIPVGAGTPRRAEFDAWRQALPQPLASPAQYAWQAGTLKIAIPLPASVPVSRPYVFPITDDVVDYEGKQHFRRVDDTLVAELPAPDWRGDRFDGVVAIGPGRGLEFRAVGGFVPEGGTPVDGSDSRMALWAFFGALLGGILLNLMPCVFPILALKALHVSKAGEGPREARLDALAYAAGAIAGTAALGALLLAIRAAGVEAGWAFQLQDPRTIMILLLLAVAITANLIGLFELPVLGARVQPAGSFGTGALAAFVATPCAGPFLGAALGAALLLPVPSALLIFAGLGLGLALPFLVLAFVPALRTRLPKPGPWMRRLQRFLAIPMAATVVAALWLLYRQAGIEALIIGLAAAAALVLIFLAVGVRQRKGAASAVLAVGGILTVSIAAVAMAPGAASIADRMVAGAERWSEARVSRALRQGEPVFVYFTADWCLTCKVNEAAAIDREEVRRAFRDKGVAVLVGDWTNGDPEITRFLEAHGRAGVPYYLWYRPGKPPEELPQVLTPAMLTDRARSAR